MLPVFRNADLDPRRWTSSGVWEVEPRKVALDRTPDFGRRFFALLFSEFPALAEEVCFLRWSSQPEDVFAVFDRADHGFTVQIDPHLELIVAQDGGAHAEIGHWFQDQARVVVDHIRRSYLERGVS